MAAGTTVIEAVKEFPKENGSFHMNNEGKSGVNGKSRGKADFAYEFFSKEQGSSSSSCSIAVDEEERGSELSLESLCINVSERSKNRSASIGTVSSIIGKDYLKTTHSKQGYGNTNKSMKLNSNVLPVSQPLVKEAKLNSGKEDKIHKEMEEFLFRMLGDGFQLERDVIRQVLDACGYDMPKSMDKLLDMSIATLDEKSKSYSGSTTDKYTGLHSKAEFPSNQSKCTRYSRDTEASASSSSEDSSAVEKHKSNLERDILTSLFCASDTKNDSVSLKARVKAVAKSRGIFGDAVREPLRDSVEELNTVTTAVHPQKHDEYDQDEERFQALRQGVKENSEMMKHYYKSAVEALRKGDDVLFGKLEEQGKFYHDKVLEAHDEYSQMILETKIVEEAEEDIVHDVSDYDAKGAIKILKYYISSLAGISSYLKLIIDSNGEVDKSNGRRRRWVLRLLEKESIGWVEGENAGTIRIRLDSINPKRLSFGQK